MNGLNDAYVASMLKRVIKGYLGKKEALVKLGCTPQYLSKLINRYKSGGTEALKHKNKGRSPKNRSAFEKEAKITSLYKHKYNGFNFTHFIDMLEENEGIKVSYCTVYRIMANEGIKSPKRQKAPHKENAHPSRPRRASFGELVQIDGSIHHWFGKENEKATLHAAIDDATGWILGSYFTKEETLFGYFSMLRQILVKYGLPQSLYGDNRTIFEFRKLSEAGKTIDRDVHIQFKRCCQQLGIELITTSVSQAKGRVERLFNTLQSRLVSELRLNKITNIDAANDFLTSFSRRFNAKFGLKPDYETSQFVPSPTEKEIDYYLSTEYERTADNGSTFSFEKQKLQLVDQDGVTVFVPSKTRISLYKTFSGILVGVYQDTFYETFNAKEIRMDGSQKKMGRPKWSPSPQHPWKRFIVGYKKKNKGN